jgi:hypothetical protein
MTKTITNHLGLLFALVLPLTAVGCADADMGTDDKAAALAAADDSVASTESAVQSCGVRSDGKLYCGNKYNAPIYDWQYFDSGVIDHLYTTYSWFTCWTTGDLHQGGNTTWYLTVGDQHGFAGLVPAYYLSTTSAFDANPSAHGLARCGF